MKANKGIINNDAIFFDIPYEFRNNISIQLIFQITIDKVRYLIKKINLNFFLLNTLIPYKKKPIIELKL